MGQSKKVKRRRGGIVYNAKSNIGQNFDPKIVYDMQWNRMSFETRKNHRGDGETITRDIPVDVLPYVTNFIKKHSGKSTTGKIYAPTIYVGCDSQVYNTDIIYSVVIGMRYVGSRGTHLIKAKFVLDGTLSIKQRLMIETYVTVTVASMLEAHLIWDGTLKNELNLVEISGQYYLPSYTNKTPYKNYVVTAIDINRNKEHKSNVALKESENYLKGMQFLVFAKPLSDIASCAADRFN